MGRYTIDDFLQGARTFFKSIANIVVLATEDTPVTIDLLEQGDKSDLINTNEELLKILAANL